MILSLFQTLMDLDAWKHLKNWNRFKNSHVDKRANVSVSKLELNLRFGKIAYELVLLTFLKMFNTFTWINDGGNFLLRTVT